MKYAFSLLTILAFPFLSWTQTGISGKVIDPETGEELINATIQLFEAGLFVQGGVTDFNGNYRINIALGTYDVLCSYLGYPDKRIENVVIKVGQYTSLNIEMDFDGYIIIDDLVLFSCGEVSLISQEPIEEEILRHGDHIRRNPSKSIKEMATMAAGVSFH